ncbi:phage tail protein [Cronobacter malonaticus]|uniref:tail fiber assembly protein n=1 Tax=Cronobacter malonaticus TaxID=413503 RepID=UPI000CFDC935|nr:tail fiber assembly protein [Cronobacter malonaticus]EGT4279790.1 phage tail protein [Cronobacter malonaticus]EGT4286933.1 phage tail protein [Cronobacter malonaticus]EGT4312858.1 phage tail protein [Cronobacter malonaticus]EGT4335352.1 phage tail protein [Cronobacter malonaticus]EGT4488799.1 phage tail protein [Cronobacter malonaticus]
MGLMLFTVALEIDYRASDALSNHAPIRDDLYNSLNEWQADGRIIISYETGQSKLIQLTIDWRAQAETRRQMLLSQAHSVTSDWRIELMLGALPDADKASLSRWMEYIRKVKALSFTCVSDEQSFKAITWPVKPG